MHILDPKLNELIDKDSDESEDEALDNINHLEKGMLNTLCDVAHRYRDKAAEMDKVLPFTSLLSPVAATKKKWKKAKVF